MRKEVKGKRKGTHFQSSDASGGARGGRDGFMKANRRVNFRRSANARANLKSFFLLANRAGAEKGFMECSGMTPTIKTVQFSARTRAAFSKRREKAPRNL